MAGLRIRIDVGNNATLGELASIASDLSHVVDVALSLAQAELIAAARERVANLDPFEPGALRERLHDETLRAEFDRYVAYAKDFEQHLRDGGPDGFYPWDRWYRRYGDLGSRRRAGVAPWFGVGSLDEFSPRVFDRLVAAEVATSGIEPPTVRLAHYENPLVVDLAGIAAILGGLGTLPRIIDKVRDWKTDKRRARARATVEEKRAELFAHLVDGAISTTQPDEFVRALSETQLLALARLAGEQIETETVEDA